MSRKPQSNLPPNSQPWGRYIEESLATLERGNSINGQNSNNNLRQLNSSVQLVSQQQGELEDQQAALSAQQAYLASFQTYTSIDTTFVVGSVNGVTTQLRQLDLSFTLSRQSQVIIEAESPYGMAARTNNWQAIWLYTGAFWLNTPSNVYGGVTDSDWLNIPNTSFIANEGSGSNSVRRVLTLPAGSHFVRAYWTYFLGGNSSVSASSSRAILTATVVG
jgi:hypothetical protein